MANNSSSSSGMRQYDMLTQCRVRIAASTVVDAPPVRPLPADVVALANAPPEPKPYDFAVEHKILAKREERALQWDMVKATVSREELEQNVLARMKSVTNASDETCISILKSNSYDLEGSIEAFLSKVSIS